MRTGRPKNSLPMPDRFWSKVDKTDGCWLWTGSVMQRGYGQFSLTGTRITTAHRMAWTLVNGEPPKQINGKPAVIMHTCDNRRCVNPNHLRLGTQKDNLLDMASKGRHVGCRGQKWRVENGRRIFYREEQ